jgi:hypothetical protein
VSTLSTCICRNDGKVNILFQVFPGFGQSEFECKRDIADNKVTVSRGSKQYQGPSHNAVAVQWWRGNKESWNELIHGLSLAETSQPYISNAFRTSYIL